jgi:iron complex transport system permease protein
VVARDASAIGVAAIPPVPAPGTRRFLLITSRTAHIPRVFVLLVLLAGVACALGILLGAVTVPPGAVLQALAGRGGSNAAIVRDLRASRVLLAFGVGGALAVAGALLQALLGNPLAEPWLLGLSGGASLGAVTALVVGLPPGWSVSACATMGALGALALVYRISSVAGRRLDPRVLILAGVVVGAFAGAITSALLIVSDPVTFQSATIWLFGGFSRSSWTLLGHFLLFAVPGLVLAWWLSRSLDLLALGDDTAATLGVDVARTRRLVIVTAAVLAAASVAASGVIGFVGLVVPHAMRSLIGPLHRTLLPAVFLAGGAFTVLADCVARSILRPGELPVGIVTALIGVPLFAMLLRRSLR